MHDRIDFDNFIGNPIFSMTYITKCQLTMSYGFVISRFNNNGMELIALDLMQQFMHNEIPSYNFLIQTRPCSKKITFEIRVFKKREIALANTFHTMLRRNKCMKLEKV